MSEKKENLKFTLILLLYLIKYSTRAVAQYVYPYYLSGLACAVLCFFPTTFLETAVHVQTNVKECFILIICLHLGLNFVVNRSIVWTLQSHIVATQFTKKICHPFFSN